ncbi:FKBP-type peptidyl-prolyl cis-trans isomerase [Hymenobacter weizhouensis]|uniref:FKBP-type peptidyl-prolyl cis-trans isomerase n=1 Tax=Hymenobacter sp. YIM 151500-1 TaxID=2987689 RepID=UPI0022268426|nr:FKBP-type peptidyl-prolyl cis-trans isomerase [Hymenobacter sp. YIM 151500-1]UYZ61685.1 FKBP-type peptidyl-prolyl cis-trans isomerase [Hymenobacter sp. YIM 151500-1]
MIHRRMKPIYFRHFALVLLFLATAIFSSCKKEEEEVDYASRDESIIQAYIKDNNLTGAERQASGLYLVRTQPGTGTTRPTEGQTVSARYKGMTLDGNVFDQNTAIPAPYSFALGKGGVIKGWDEGFALLTKGEKAILLIPSGLAYGSTGASRIPPNAVLRFDVELVDFK